MSNFKVNGIDLDDLLMQSTNNNSGSSGFVMANGQDLYAKYGKWDGLTRNQLLATGFTINGEDINRKFNKIEPTFQATLSGTFTYTGRSIQPNILVSPDDTTDYTITYNGNKKDVASYLAVEGDFILPPGYVWDTNHPQGSFTIYHKSVSFTFTGTGSFEYNGSPRSIIIIPNDSNATYSITNGSVGPKTNVSDGSTTVTVTANGNYSGSATSASLSITPKPVTITITGGGTFEYNSTVSRSMSVLYGGNSFSSYQIISGSLGPITNVSQSPISVTVQANGNYSSSQISGTITITAATLTGTATNATLSFNGASQTRTVITGINGTYSGSENATGTNGGTYTTSISGTGNYSGSVSGGNLYIVQASITSQPTDGTADSGSSVTLSIIGSGLPSGGSISYQWYTSSGSIISGATNSSYSASTSGSYYCTITYTYNSVSHTVSSSTATVTISAPPRLTGNITNTDVYWDGESHTASINVTAGSYTSSNGTTSVSDRNIGEYTVTLTDNYDSTNKLTARLTIREPKVTTILSAAIYDNGSPANVIPYFTGFGEIYINGTLVLESAVSGTTYNLNTIRDDPYYIGDITSSGDTIELRVTDPYGQTSTYGLRLNCTEISGTTSCSFIEI